MRGLAVIAGLVVLVGLTPAASACHVAFVEHAGVVVEDGTPRTARLEMPLDACEGEIEVAIDVDNGSAPERIDAELDVVQPADADCLPWDPCVQTTPPVVVFELTAGEDVLSLNGTTSNLGHLNEQVTLTGTYRGNASSFTFVKPL